MSPDAEINELRARLERTGKVKPPEQPPDTLVIMGRPPASLAPHHATEVRAKARAYERARAKSDQALKDLYKAVRKAASAGASLRAIAAEIGVSHPWIQQILKKGEKR